MPGLTAGSTLTVPDDAATIQTALDAAPDTVLIRPGPYADPVVPCRDVVLAAAESEMPVLSALRLACDHRTVLFHRLAFSAPVLVGAPLGNDSTAATACVGEATPGCYRFEECDLRAGIAHNQDHVDINCVELFRCTVAGVLDIRLQGACAVESCHVQGRLEVREGGARVRACTFVGDGTGTAIDVTNSGICELEGNAIRGYERGIAASADGMSTVRDNVVESCSSVGIQVYPHGAVMDRNQVRDCGYGIITGNRGSITNNRIEACKQMGALIINDADDLEFRGNVVVGCAEEGVRVRGYPGNLVVAGNTIARNGGSGIVMELGMPYWFSKTDVRQNVAYGNAKYGIQWVGENAASTQICNDWFGNDAGASVGELPGSDDFSSDPLFCDEANGDYRLASSSPLVDWRLCGLIGALDIGCAAPAIPPPATAGFALEALHPNPFPDRVGIDFTLARTAEIRIDVFDIQGRLLTTPAKGAWPAGSHAVEWSAGSAGIYLVRYRYPGGEDRRRIVRIR
jgi:hypothetical protein